MRRPKGHGGAAPSGPGKYTDGEAVIGCDDYWHYDEHLPAEVSSAGAGEGEN